MAFSLTQHLITLVTLVKLAIIILTSVLYLFLIVYVNVTLTYVKDVYN